MRAGRVRIVLGLSRRRVGVRVPGARWTGQRPRDRDRRGHRARGLAASRAKGIRRGGRSAVRFLHARPHRGDARPAAAGASAERRSDPRGAGRQHLPLHRVREDHRRGSACGGAHAMSETPHPTLPGERGGKKPRLAPPARTTGRVGESVPRPDGALKVRGDFPYSSDLQVEGMIWGATLRSPHPYARIISIDTTEAHSMPGVHAVLTHHDVPGRNVYGLEIQDQPVLAFEVVRYWGEAVALVAADHPEQARRAAEKVHVEYEVLPPVTEAERALSPDAPSLHPGGNVTRWVKIRHGEAMPRADVVVRGEYEIGMQDQAPLGPESGLAVPDGEGGVDLDGGDRQRVVLCGRPVSVPKRDDRRHRRLHQQPALRRDAWLWLGPELLRPRGADGQARRGARDGPGRAAHPQRDGDRQRDDHGPADRRPGPSRRAAAPGESHAASPSP